MRLPIATYRVQLTGDFGFAQAQKLLPMLQAAGITDLYASPIFQARTGSTHGYDVTDPSRVSADLGGETAFQELTADLQRRGMGLMIDIVPNHMAASAQNPWWTDVLENGSGSRFSVFFDVQWGPAGEAREDKIFIPILGSPYGTVLENREFSIEITEAGMCVCYYNARPPLDPSSYLEVLAIRPDKRPDSDRFRELLERIARLPERTAIEWEQLESRWREVPVIKEMLWALYSSDAKIKEFIDENIRTIRGEKEDAASFDALDHLLGRQAYQLAYWQAAREKINYRRFFDVSDLIGIHMEDPQVFAKTHEFILRLAREGTVTGLRIDHVDGLFDPIGYLKCLKAGGCANPAGKQTYIVVEKILLGSETLPTEWPIQGTTGYDYLNIANGLFVDIAGMAALREAYAQFTRLNWTFEDSAYEQKRWIIEHLFHGELFAMSLHLELLAEYDRHARDLSPSDLRRALAEVTACLPVYRTYIREPRVDDRDRLQLDRTFADAERRNPDMAKPVFQFLRRILLLQFPENLPEARRNDWLRFVMRWQQLSSPIAAKGVEDTTHYLYNPLVSLNEVGSIGEAIDSDRFHRFLAEHQQRWPDTMNATSTHDTKRSEDVRARINVLSEMPSVWSRYLNRWSRWNRGKKQVVNDRQVPDPNEEALLYQTLLGTWPLTEAKMPDYKDRIKAYLVKAAREAKVYSSWLKPNEAHERALQSFVDEILDPHPQNRFLEHFLEFQKRIAFAGAINSLSQMILKIAAPGIPDFYQGTFVWDFSLVDPDNRRPLDMSRREALTLTMEQWRTESPREVAAYLLSHWRDGELKAYVIFQALRSRVEDPELFQKGKYIPLSFDGEASQHAVGFARRLGNRWILAIVPRFVSKYTDSDRFPLGKRVWHDARLILPASAPQRWRNAFTGEAIDGEAAIPLSDVFRNFPAALLVAQNDE